MTDFANCQLSVLHAFNKLYLDGMNLALKLKRFIIQKIQTNSMAKMQSIFSNSLGNTHLK